MEILRLTLCRIGLVLSGAGGLLVMTGEAHPDALREALQSGGYEEVSTDETDGRTHLGATRPTALTLSAMMERASRLADLAARHEAMYLGAKLP